MTSFRCTFTSPCLKAIAALATLLTGLTSSVSAQPQFLDLVQSAPATEGASVWGRDNCSYQFQNGAWVKLDLCRVMRGAKIYDTYIPSTRQWGAHIDESKPGRIMMMSLDPQLEHDWFLATTSGKPGLYVWRNNQWQDFAVLVRAWQEQNTASQNAGSLARMANSIVISSMDARSRAAQEQNSAAYQEERRNNQLANDRAVAVRAENKALADKAAADRAQQRAQNDQQLRNAKAYADQASQSAARAQTAQRRR